MLIYHYIPRIKASTPAEIITINNVVNLNLTKYTVITVQHDRVAVFIKCLGYFFLWEPS